MNRSILSINANRPMNYLLQTVLTGKYKLVSVADAFSGMYELKRKQNIELVIVDVDHHPEESWDFIQHITTSRLYQKPIIVLTSDNSKRTNEKMAEAQVFDFFHKPFSPLELLKAVDEFMISNPSLSI